MEMMYARVGQALQAVGDSTSHPTDYLLFLCPGKNKSIDHKTHYWLPIVLNLSVFYLLLSGAN